MAELLLCRDCRYMNTFQECLRTGLPDPVDGEYSFQPCRVERAIDRLGRCGPKGIHFSPKGREAA